MSGKNVDDYLTEGIYGVKKPKQAELNRFLGTFRERIVFCLTIGEVMKNKGLEQLIHSMEDKADSRLLLNGQINFKYLSKIKEIASKHSISYTVISNNDIETDIGAVLCVDHAIDYENIFLDDIVDKKPIEQKSEPKEPESFMDKIKSLFKS